MKRLILFLFVAMTITAYSQYTGTYNVGTGETYTTLKSFFDAVNAGTVDGDITVLITSDLTEAANVGLGVNTNSHSITIRPSADVNRTITFTQLADNTSPTGHLVIGYVGSGLTSAYSDANTIATSNVTIDGYAVGGSTKRLIFTNTSANHVGARVIVVVGACQNTVIKNCIINNLTTSTSSPFCIGAVVRKGTAIEVAPSNLTIENNTLTATGSNVAMGSRLTNSGTITSASITGFVFKNNIVTAKRRLLELNYINGGEIYGNEFTTMQTGAPGTVSYGLWSSTSVTGTFNIYKNNFKSATTEETGAFGHRVVSLASTATYNIYNNMFTGLNKTMASSVGLNLTYLFFSGVSGTIYNNTFYMPALTNASSTGYYSCIQLSGNTATIKNNIFISNEGVHSNPYFISAVPTPTPDYNDYYIRASANTSHKVISTYATFADYRTANSSKDPNSKTVDVVFTDTTNLHLAGGSMGNGNLAGTPLASVTTDFDGDSRHATYPYMGADETTPSLPVELTAFTGTANGKNIELRWTTATEQNNRGFEVERLSAGVWTKIAFVAGAGNSNAPKEYRYTDAVSGAGSYSYRLKQVDVDGMSHVYAPIEVAVTTSAAPQSFGLTQNFPNPFNPMTTIRFSVKQTGVTSVKVYDITGREVAELFNDVASAGQSYAVQFNGANLASGTYLYVLQSPGTREVKKMQLLK